MVPQPVTPQFALVPPYCVAPQRLPVLSKTTPVGTAPSFEGKPRKEYRVFFVHEPPPLGGTSWYTVPFEEPLLVVAP